MSKTVTVTNSITSVLLVAALKEELSLLHIQLPNKSSKFLCFLCVVYSLYLKTLVNFLGLYASSTKVLLYLTTKQGVNDIPLPL
jgi:hypothetical protein